MQLRERANQQLPQEANTELNAIPQTVQSDAPQPSYSPSRTTPVGDVEELVPQLQPLSRPQRVLLDWEGLIIVAEVTSKDRHILILKTTRMTPPVGSRVNIREVGSISGYAQHVQLPWLVHNKEARVTHEGAYTRLTLIR